MSTLKTGNVVRVWLPRRNPAGHKGTFGTVSVVGGCCAGEVRMIGAPALAAAAALRAGCGLARLVMPGPIVEAGLMLVPSATGRGIAVDARGSIKAEGLRGAIEAVRTAMAESDAVVLGPGMGQSRGTASAVRAALDGFAKSRCTLVLDADGLNAVAAGGAGWISAARDGRGGWGARGAGGLVLTPHPGEFERLATALGLEADAMEPSRRSAAAQMMAKRMGAVVVLKGARTVVADPERVWVSESADPALATAGTGDVLAGLIGGLLAATWTARGFLASAQATAALKPTEFWPGTGSGAGSAAKHAADALKMRREVGTVDAFGVCVVAVQAHAAAAAAWRKRHRASAGLMAMELAAELPAALERFRK